MRGRAAIGQSLPFARYGCCTIARMHPAIDAAAAGWHPLLDSSSTQRATPAGSALRVNDRVLSEAPE